MGALGLSHSSRSRRLNSLSTSGSIIARGSSSRRISRGQGRGSCAWNFEVSETGSLERMVWGIGPSLLVWVSWSLGRRRVPCASVRLLYFCMGKTKPILSLSISLGEVRHGVTLLIRGQLAMFKDCMQSMCVPCGSGNSRFSPFLATSMCLLLARNWDDASVDALFTVSCSSGSNTWKL